MNRKGFTLSEMIAAIVILALIITLAVASYNGIRTSILEKDYKNLVSYLEAKAANYTENTGELNVSVEKLIEAGYIEADSDNQIINPIDKTSMNCYMLESVFSNGNYNATMGDNIGTDASGKCNTYEVNKEIEICVMEGNTCNNTIEEWYNKNVTLGVKIGGSTELANSSNVAWKYGGSVVNTPTIVTQVYSVNKGVYTVEVRYEVETDNGIKRFEGSDTVQINVDLEKPTIEKITISKENEWVNTEKEIKFQFSDKNGSGIYKAIVFETNNPNQGCPALSASGWLEVDESYIIAKPKGNYKVCVSDHANNVSDAYPINDLITIDKIDSEKPSCNITVTSGITGENGWYITYPSIAMTYSDDDSSVIAYGLSKENKVYYNKIDNINQNSDVESQSYFGYVRDGASNEGTCKLEGIKVDTTAPTLSAITKSTTGWTNANVTISSNATDNTSKLFGYNITTTAAKPITWNSLGLASSKTITYSAPGNGTYYIWVKDNAGNSKYQTTTISNIDKIKPTVSAITKSTTNWTNGNVTLVSTLTDNESKLVGYAVTTSATTPTSWTKLSSVASYKVSYAASSNATYYIWAKDAAGNIEKSSVSVTNIDKTKPTVSAISKSTSNWTSGNVTLTSTLADSGSKLVGYAVTTSSSTPSSWSSLSSVASYTVSYTATSNATYYIWAKDAAGNIEKSSVSVTNIDKTAPSVGTISKSPTGWTNGNVTITSTISDSGAKLVGYAVTTSSSTPSSWSSLSSVASYTVSYTATTNGTYYVWAKDGAGNINKLSISVTNIDKIKPVSQGKEY